MAARVLRPGKHFHVLPLVIPMRYTKSKATASIYGRLSLTLVKSCARALLSRVRPSLVVLIIEENKMHGCQCPCEGMVTDLNCSVHLNQIKHKNATFLSRRSHNGTFNILVFIHNIVAKTPCDM